MAFADTPVLSACSLDFIPFQRDKWDRDWHPAPPFALSFYRLICPRISPPGLTGVWTLI